MNPRLIDEICTIGKLEQYRKTLTSILTIIQNNGCSISTRYDVRYSNIEQNIGSSSRIRVSMINVANPLDIIWKLLHEYGHYLSGPKMLKDTLMQREELAWTYADKLVQLYPDLVAKIDDYETCKEVCLDSYRKKKSSD